MAWQQEADSAQRLLLTTFDHRPRWFQAKPPRTTMIVRGFRRFFGSDEVDLLNAYGVKGCELICDLSTFNGDQPEKLDRFQVEDEMFTVQSSKVIQGYANARLLVRCYCRGG